jgi:DHA2 family multidrug resistance protein
VNPWIVAIAVMFATFMEVLDTTVVNDIAFCIAGSLSATIDESTWALTSYLVANDHPADDRLARGSSTANGC